MNAKKFSDAMSELDTKYVDEALNYKKKAKRPGWIKWGAMAACLCLIVMGIFVIPQLMTSQNPQSHTNTPVEGNVEGNVEGSTDNQDEICDDYFNAVVLEIHNDYILVEHLGVSNNLTFESDNIEVALNVISESSIPQLQVGDTVRIVFVASNNTVPSKIENVVSIQLID